MNYDFCKYERREHSSEQGFCKDEERRFHNFFNRFVILSFKPLFVCTTSLYLWLLLLQYLLMIEVVMYCHDWIQSAKEKHYKLGIKLFCFLSMLAVN